VDVLVIMPLKTGEREVTRAAAIRDRVRSTFPMDVLVRTPQHVSRKLAQGDGFISQILQHGRLIYEAEHP
jgi:hypothetical protein